MFDFKILEIAIGLIFIYLLLSLLATAVNEFIIRFLYSRGKNLKRAIVRMLADSVKDPKKDDENAENNEYLVKAFYTHPLIEKFTNPSKWGWLFNLNTPSYLSNSTFSKVLLEVLGDKNSMNANVQNIKDKIKNLFPKVDSSTRQVLLNLIEDSGDDLEKLKANLESWYEQMMDRASGWYKRRVQIFLLIIGFFISALFNADTIQMVKTLSNDPATRAAMIEMAENYIANIKGRQEADSLAFQNGKLPALQSQSDTVLYDEIEQLVTQDIPEAGSIMGMGWKFPPKVKNCWGKVWFVICCIPGWLITSFAIALGAPFWFDMLGKVVNIRNTGRKPDDKASTTQQPVG